MNKINRGDTVLCDCGFEKFQAIVVDVSEDSYLVKPIDKKLGTVNDRCTWIAARDVTFSNTCENLTADTPSKAEVKENTVVRPHESGIKTGKDIDHN